MSNLVPYVPCLPYSRSSAVRIYIQYDIVSRFPKITSRFNDSLGRLTEFSMKEYKAKLAKGKDTWGEVWKKPRNRGKLPQVLS